MEKRRKHKLLDMSRRFTSELESVFNDSSEGILLQSERKKFVPNKRGYIGIGVVGIMSYVLPNKRGYVGIGVVG